MILSFFIPQNNTLHIIEGFPEDFLFLLEGKNNLFEDFFDNFFGVLKISLHIILELLRGEDDWHFVGAQVSTLHIVKKVVQHGLDCPQNRPRCAGQSGLLQVMVPFQKMRDIAADLLQQRQLSWGRWLRGDVLVGISKQERLKRVVIAIRTQRS